MPDKKPAPFAEGGIFHDNVRNISKIDDTQLKASMRKIGWIQECPAIIDEHGVVIVGHRRLKIAKELGIPPVIDKLTFGDGPSGQAKRLELAAASNLGFAKMDKSARKKIAEQFTEMGWTQKQIADVLDVDRSTVSDDLKGFVASHKPDRPKGGRPRKSAEQVAAEKATKEKEKADAAKAKEEAKAKAKQEHLDTKEVDPERGRIAGVDVKVEKAVWTEFNKQAQKQKKSATALISELVTGYVDPEVKPEALSMTAQEKLDAATRQYQKRLDQEFERRVQDEVKRRVDDIVLPHWKKKIDEAQKLYARRKGVMDKATFTKIRACLHTDRLAQLLDIPVAKLDPNLAKRYNEATSLFEGLEKLLLDEKDSPTHIGDVPDNLEEWDKAKREVAAARKAGRTSVGRPR